MTLDRSYPRTFPPAGQNIADRERRLRALGLGADPDPEFDAFAKDLAAETGTPFAMVNFVGGYQYFAGLYADTSRGAAVATTAQTAAEVGRTMPLDHGWCPHVVEKRKGLVLGDVCEFPRFATNLVVDKVGIRAYLGAPLIDRTQTVLGTICVVDQDTHEWGRPELSFIKDRALTLIDIIHRREIRP